MRILFMVTFTPIGVVAHYLGLSGFHVRHHKRGTRGFSALARFADDNMHFCALSRMMRMTKRISTVRMVKFVVTLHKRGQWDWVNPDHFAAMQPPYRVYWH